MPAAPSAEPFTSLSARILVEEKAAGALWKTQTPQRCLLPALFFYLLSRKSVRANKKIGQSASRWQFVVGRYRFMCIRGYWRLLLALRVPVAAVPGRGGLWFPWRLRSWRCVSGFLCQFVPFALAALWVLVRFAFLALLPWLLSLLFSWLSR